MRTIEAYQTDDGRRFFDKQEAAEHESIKRLDDFLDSLDDFYGLNSDHVEALWKHRRQLIEFLS